MFTGPGAHRGTSATTVSAGGTTENGTNDAAGFWSALMTAF